MTDYERYQLEWMIDHGHSLGELMNELTGMQLDYDDAPSDNGETVAELFKAWESDIGFGGEVYACEAEWRDEQARELEIAKLYPDETHRCGNSPAIDLKAEATSARAASAALEQRETEQDERDSR